MRKCAMEKTCWKISCSEKYLLHNLYPKHIKLLVDEFSATKTVSSTPAFQKILKRLEISKSNF